jgi:PEGA domain
MDDAVHLSDLRRRDIGSPAPGSLLALVICGFGLAGCGTSKTIPGLDAFKPKPTTTILLIQTNPDGADARSSLGATCHTPCTMTIGTAGDFTISFTRDGYEPQTITVHSTMSEGDYTTPASPTLDPNRVSVALKPQARQPVRPPSPGPARNP